MVGNAEQEPSAVERVSDEVFWGYMGALQRRQAAQWLRASGVPEQEAATAVVMSCARGGFSDAHQLRLVVQALDDARLSEADRGVLELMRAELEFDVAEVRRRERSYRDALVAYRALPRWRRWRTAYPQY
ncbi:hypothetical protein GCM10009839_88990 [Catenulispora yoronensis]|uniref:Uncharacterized protein n=1 Tax=Catenulispora yoronensis TaxID=450799 RepID=A0ABP5H480_9ACTN